MEKYYSNMDDDMRMPQPEWKDYNNVTEEFAMKKTCELLNMIDFKEMLSDAKHDVDDIRKQVEHKVLFEERLNEFMVKNENVFEGLAFNWMSEEEFAEYLKERYDGKIHYNEYEVIHREIRFK